MFAWHELLTDLAWLKISAHSDFIKSSRSGLKSEFADIFHQSLISGCYATLTSPKEGETAVYGYNPAPFWVLGVVLMSCRVNFHVVRSALQYSACRIKYVHNIIFADQVFIDPAFFSIFVCGPLQSLVVNVCIIISSIFFFTKIIFIFSCSGMFRHVPECSVFLVLSTPPLSLLHSLT